MLGKTDNQMMLSSLPMNSKLAFKDANEHIKRKRMEKTNTDWPDVHSSRRGKLTFKLSGERSSEHILGESLRSEHCLLLPPVPHRQHVVWISSLGGQQGTIWTVNG